MKRTDYLWIAAHVALGILITKGGVSAKAFAWGLTAFVFLAAAGFRSWKNLTYLTAYVAGAEVFDRMTQGLYFYESHKYMAALLFGAIILRTGLRWVSLPYLIYLLLLLPGIFYTYLLEAADPSYIHVHLRKDILFNISGPVTLGVGAVALAKMPFRMEDFKRLLFFLLLPVITTTVYIIVHTPSLKEIVFRTSANFATSGGFGPNQVATILGLGMFASFALFWLSKERSAKIVYLLLFFLISYRSFLTFSRGGTMTGIAMILIFAAVSRMSRYRREEGKNGLLILVSLLILVAGYYTAVEISGGMLYNRYAGLTASGEKKEDYTSGRWELFLVEVEDFLKNPFTGAGVGRAKIERYKDFGIRIATHNEISRLLAEHGLFGLAALLILLFAPLWMGLVTRENLFFYPFYVFWLFTIFHSSMRLSAPAVIYAFALLWPVNERLSATFSHNQSGAS